MELDIFDNIDYIFDIGISYLNIPKRYIRDGQDPYAISVNEFKIRYRFTQNTVKNIILPLIIETLRKDDRRGLPIAPELQLLICLRFYATASFQIVCGDLLNVSQPAVSNIVTKISKLLAQKHRQFIKYPENINLYRLEFARLGQYRQHIGLRNIDGAIDCTHIKIVNTPGVEHHEVFRNRKSYFSINVQAVVGPHGEFMDVVARWAGSTHDSRIFQMSNINMKYCERIHNGKLVGDSGYPCLPYLLTPFNSASSPSEEIYNKVHAKTRNIVERVFGQWKRRFPCLHRGMGNKLSTVSNIIIACAILFNIGLGVHDEPPVENVAIGEIAEENREEHNNNPHSVGGSAEGFAIRAAIINNYI